MEVNIISNRENHLIDPVLHIWGWEIPVYLFLGGLTAGILVLAAVIIWLKKEEKFPVIAYTLPLWSPVLLSLGMTALFLDLEHKSHVWRFYTSFQITAPMSWGSWLLLFVYPLNILLILANLDKSWPRLFGLLKNRAIVGAGVSPGAMLFSLSGFARKHKRTVAKCILPAALGLGIYTGILLSAYVARPFWNASILGPLFLLSGISSALALAVLFSRIQSEREFYSKGDLIFLISEMLFLVLFVLSLMAAPLQKAEAVGLILGGKLTAAFWIFLVGIGLVVPLCIELMEWKGQHIPRAAAPMFVLFGGLYFRFFMVQAGQISTWIP